MVDYYTPIRHPPRRRPSAALRALARIGIWVLAVVVLAVVIGGCGIFGTGAAGLALLYPWMLICIAMLVLISHMMRAVRQQRVLSILGYLHQAIRLNMPLVPWLHAAASAERGTLGRRLRALATLLGHAIPIASAIDGAVPEARERQVAVLDAAEQTGQLAPALRRLLHEQRGPALLDRVKNSFAIMYASMMIMMLILMLALIMVFVVPKFELIFLDFNIRLPGPTVLLLELSRTIGLPLVIGAIAWMIILVARTLERILIGWRSRTILRPLADLASWHLPLLRGPVRSRQYGDFCHAMAGALHGALPMPRAAMEVSPVATNTRFREMLAEWMRQMDQGTTAGEAARQAGMPSVMVGLLASSTDGQNAADVFGFLGRYYQSRFGRAQALARAAIIPVAVLLFGAIVGFVALSLYLPLIHLTDATQLIVGF